jgi:hypothetical protein
MIAVAGRLGHANAVVTMMVYAHVDKLVDRGLLTVDELGLAAPMPAEVAGGLPPGVDPEERRRAVAPGTVLQHALGHGHSEVGYRSVVVGEAQLGVVSQIADNDGLVVAGHQA